LSGIANPVNQQFLMPLCPAWRGFHHAWQNHSRLTRGEDLDALVGSDRFSIDGLETGGEKTVHPGTPPSQIVSRHAGKKRRQRLLWMIAKFYLARG